MSTVKSFAVVAIMIACFVVIYPRFMHPFVLRTLGLYEAPKTEADNNAFPPHHRAMHPGGPKPKPIPDEPKKNMKQSPPHPGMRAAADMQRQQSQQGSGRGMMGVVLPMYAIGIVLYLVYTLFKVFNKSKSNSWEGSQYENRLEHDYSVDRLGLPADGEGIGDVRSFFTDDQQRKDLEHLLTRVDDKNVSVDEMRMLQKRLEETEAQMSRILKAMQSVQTNVGEINLPEDTEESKVESNDMSPDIESYEVVGKEGEINNKRGVQEDGKSDSRERKDLQAANEHLPSNIDEKKERKIKLKREVDLDGIDKDSEEDDYNVDEDEIGADEKFEEETDDNDTSNTKVSNIRQRKGRRDNEQ